MIGASNRKLILMRHAKSDWADSSISDKDRPLNARGRAATPIVAQWLQTNQAIPDIVLCSSATRTKQTLELLLDQWPKPSPEVIYLDELYLAPAAQILSIASKHDSRNSLLVLGHNPGMEDLASYLSQARIEMPTAGIALLEAIGRNWPDDWLQASSWSWRGLVKPRDLGKETI